MKTYFIKNWAGSYVSKDDNTLWCRDRTHSMAYSTKDLDAAKRRADSIRNGERQFGNMNKCRVVSTKGKA